MFLKSKVFVIVAIGILLFTACGEVVYFPIDVKKPSEINVSNKKYNSVLVVNNIPPVAPIKNYIYTLEDNKDITFNMDSLGYLFTSKFSESLKEKGFCDEVLYTTSGYLKSPSDSSSLSIDSIQTMAEETGAGLIFSIDNLDVNSKYWYNPVRMDSLQTNATVLIHVYSPEGNEIMPIRNNYSLMWESYGRKSFFEKSVIQKSIKTMIALFSGVMSDKLVPQWQTRYRWYYTSDKKMMTIAAGYVDKSEWVMASKIWEKLYNEEKGESTLSKLASNIALANEMTDNIENAIKWVSIAKEYKVEGEDRKRLEEYEKELVQRLSEFKKMDQMNQ